MPLRSPEIVGITDPRELTRPPQRGRAPSTRKPHAADRETETDLGDAPDAAMIATGVPLVARGEPADKSVIIDPEAPAPDEREAANEPAAVDSANAKSVPDEQERAFVQILVPPELAVRIGRASHHLKLEVYKARFQQTIMGALIDASISDPNNPDVIAAMATLIARWRQDPLSERRASRRLGWHLPLPLSTRLDQLVLNLKEQHYRLRPSITSLVSALIWFELDPDSAEGQAELRELVIPYHDKWERPDYSLAAA